MVVQRIIDGVESCTAIDRNCFVARNAQLHANALEQRFGELEDSRAPIGRDMLGAVQDGFGFVHRGARAERSGGAKFFHGPIFQCGLVEQTAACVGIVVGAEERFLKAPVQEVPR